MSTVITTSFCSLVNASFAFDIRAVDIPLLVGASATYGGRRSSGSSPS